MTRPTALLICLESCCRLSLLRAADWLPLVWYLLGVVGVVGVPLVNSIFQERPSQFGEHCITVLATAGCVWGLVLTARVKAILRRIHQNHPTYPAVGGGAWQVNDAKRQITYFGSLLDLSRTEYDLKEDL